MNWEMFWAMLLLFAGIAAAIAALSQLVVVVADWLGDGWAFALLFLFLAISAALSIAWLVEL